MGRVTNTMVYINNIDLDVIKCTNHMYQNAMYCTIANLQPVMDSSKKFMHIIIIYNEIVTKLSKCFLYTLLYSQNISLSVIVEMLLS